jgi:hypothetical protein
MKARISGLMHFSHSSITIQTKIALTPMAQQTILDVMILMAIPLMETIPAKTDPVMEREALTHQKT